MRGPHLVAVVVAVREGEGAAEALSVKRVRGREPVRHGGVVEVLPPGHHPRALDEGPGREEGPAAAAAGGRGAVGQGAGGCTRVSAERERRGRGRRCSVVRALVLGVEAHVLGGEGQGDGSVRCDAGTVRGGGRGAKGPAATWAAATGARHSVRKARPTSFPRPVLEDRLFAPSRVSIIFLKQRNNEQNSPQLDWSRMSPITLAHMGHASIDWKDSGSCAATSSDTLGAMVTRSGCAAASLMKSSRDPLAP